MSSFRILPFPSICHGSSSVSACTSSLAVVLPESSHFICTSASDTSRTPLGTAILTMIAAL